MRGVVWLMGVGFVLALECCGGGESVVDAGPVVGIDVVDRFDTAPDAAPDGVADVAPDAALDVEADTPEIPLWRVPRPEAGVPLTATEIHDFTKRITGFWKSTHYFRWVRFTSHGLDASNPQGQFHYALWWQDTAAEKAGDTVTFTHFGRADNLTLRTCKVLSNAISGYLMTGDEDMRWIVEEYSRGLVALGKAMEFGVADPVPYLQARAVFNHDHSYETVGGRKVAIDYGPVRHDEEAWNASIIHNPDNPTWGDIWLVNQRSKDDVGHMFRVVPALKRAVAEAKDQSVRDAAQMALDYMEGFAADIVANGYQIRTKYADGKAVVPTKPEDGLVKDLASFVLYEIADPNAECNAKLGASLIGGAGMNGLDCEQGSGNLYELIATQGHFFNYAIIGFFHLAALTNAIGAGEEQAARGLMEGLATRADAMMHDPEQPHRDDPSWDADAAAFLLASGAAGLPLTHEEARLVRDQYTASVTHFEGWPYWDPWAASVSDGPIPFQPERGTAVRPEEMAYLMEYCDSPLRSADGAPLVDCSVIADPARWGE